MRVVYLQDYSIFLYKETLFFAGSLGIIKIKIPSSLKSLLFRITKLCIKIEILKLNKTNIELAKDVSTEIRKILTESNNGFSSKIIISGIGFRSWTYKSYDDVRCIILKIGFSKDLSIKIPYTLKVVVLKPSLILFKSIDKHILNQFVASLRQLKTTDCYKGKGLGYITEKVVLKTGKK